MAYNSEKNLKRYYSISEVAEIFQVNESLLRYWEKEFPHITPRKCGRNVRQYTQENIDDIRLIYTLLKVRGMKIAAARESLKNNKEAVVSNSRLIERLQDIRSELVALKKELDRV